MTQVSMTNLVAGALSGCVVSFPTDTVPALAVLPDRAAKIFALKQRSQNKPLILMAATSDDLWPFVTGSASECLIWQQAAQAYWPGALTLVLPASSRVPRAMNPASPTTIGLRVPECPVARSLLAQTGALATTSANLSGQPPLQTIAEIEAQFPDVLTLLPDDAGAVESTKTGVPSTVVKWTGKGWEIIRQGGVKFKLEDNCEHE